MRMSVFAASLLFGLSAACFAEPANSSANETAAVEQAMITVAYDFNMKGYPAPLLTLQVHLRHITNAALERIDATAATLANNLGYHLRMIGALAASVWRERRARAPSRRTA